MGANDREYRSAINKSLLLIERKLTQSIEHEDLAKEGRFSKAHFYRIFQTVIGITAGSYIRSRRLAKAAAELAHSNSRVLDIALKYHFQSQEAFTRAFKKVYGITPGNYRTYSRTLIQKREGIPMNNTAPKGWSITGSRIEEYVVSTDKEEAHLGKCSVRLESVGKAKQDAFVTLMQMCSADPYIGRRIRLTAFVKSEEVKGWAGLWMRIDRKSGDMLKFDNMQDRSITGTRDWNLYAVVLDVPESSHAVAFGVLLCGRGKAWVDNFKIEIVDDKTPVTGNNAEEELPKEPVNLDFEAS
ncbi:helix-turn-helix transcriptional regulator [Paenibacillus lemnae]|uniref:Helix-turn-helix transcriptional regulator n=1 Tax=Paenibacillus lemnae TaxID=1330551 RepID=A0A848M8T2_PAELE|nr:helix-turn-helix transcriptional regulator [Paenibacillus lemnae]NMO97628.1 helix-turn-helix transcriptional regulator [Paenibacillus lemnae]